MEESRFHHLALDYRAPADSDSGLRGNPAQYRQEAVNAQKRQRRREGKVVKRNDEGRWDPWLRCGESKLRCVSPSGTGSHFAAEAIRGTLSIGHSGWFDYRRLLIRGACARTSQRLRADAGAENRWERRQRRRWRKAEVEMKLRLRAVTPRPVAVRSGQ